MGTRWILLWSKLCGTFQTLTSGFSSFPCRVGTHMHRRVASSRTQILPTACPNSSVTGSRTNDQVSFLSVLSVQGLETKISLSGETGFPTTFRVMITVGGGGRVGGLLGKRGWGPLQRSELVYPSFISARLKSEICKCRVSTLPLHCAIETLRNTA